MTRTLLIAVCMLAGVAAAQATGFDCGKFQKNDDGTWHAVQAVEIFGPRGRIDFTPDETYKVGQEKQGLDIAKLLDANCAKK